MVEISKVDQASHSAGQPLAPPPAAHSGQALQRLQQSGLPAPAGQTGEHVDSSLFEPFHGGSFLDAAFGQSAQAAPASQPAPAHHGGGGLLGAVEGVVNSGASLASGVVNSGEQAAGQLVHDGSGLVSGAVHTGEGLVNSGEQAAGQLVHDGSGLVSGAVHTGEGLVESGVHAVESAAAGKYDIPAPGLPAYPQLNPQLKAQAMQRGAGQTLQVPTIQDPGGGHHEPITLEVSAPLDKLKQALASQGWTPPNLFPMSPMSVDGKPAVDSLTKNSQLGGLSRDHLRIFELPSSQGQPLWGIAASRDTQPFVRVSDKGVTFAHEVDPNLDGERDLVMNDLLAASPTARDTWKVVQGQPDPPSRGYTSDGQVYTLSL